MFGLNMNLVIMCSDSFSPYFGFLLSGFCFSRMPLVPTSLPQRLCMVVHLAIHFSFLTVVQYLAPNAYICLVWVLAIDCVWTQEWFVLWMWLFVLKIHIFQNGIHWPSMNHNEKHCLGLSSWFLSIWTMFQGFSSWDFVLPEASGRR